MTVGNVISGKVKPSQVRAMPPDMPQSQRTGKNSFQRMAPKDWAIQTAPLKNHGRLSLPVWMEVQWAISFSLSMPVRASSLSSMKFQVPVER